MKRIIGTRAYGLRTPIIKEGDNLHQILPQVLDDVIKYEDVQIKDHDILAITESLLARSQGNYCHLDHIVQDLEEKFDEEIGVVFPILSRNRFSLIMKAIAQTKKKIKVFLMYPNDEVGNALFPLDLLLETKVNANTDTLTEEDYHRLTKGKSYHQYTGVDYLELYKSYALDDNIEIYLTNNPYEISKMAKELLVCHIHDRAYYTQLFKSLHVPKVFTLADIMNHPIDGSGYNEEFGLYGSNLASPTSLKLFPRGSQAFVEDLQRELYDRFGKQVEVMIYGDGAFKDPGGQIWELADPVVSPGYTQGLAGEPNEIKIKYLADTELEGMTQEEMNQRLVEEIEKKDTDQFPDKALGTTPRKITDLIGSLADLTSGSGDKGTPIVLIQGYFDNFASK